MVPEILTPATEDGISEFDRIHVVEIVELTKAGLVVSLNNVAHDNLAGTDTAVVRALRSRETAVGPAKRTVVQVEEGVLLLKTEPRLMVGISLHHLVAVMAEVVLVGGTISVPALSQDDDVGRSTEGIGVDGARTEINVRVVAGGLAGRGAVKVPDGEIFGLVLALFQGLKEMTQ